MTRKKTSSTSLDTTDRQGALLRPLVTEKAARGTERGVYLFEVLPDATASEVAKAFANRYGITPRKVNVLNEKSKVVRRRTTRGRTAARRKAYVYLPVGKTIEVL